MANPRPISVEYINPADYDGPAPQPLAIVGFAPEGGGGGQVTNHGAQSGPVTLAAGTNTITLTGDVSLTVPALADGAELTVFVQQDGTGGHGLSWGGVVWQSGDGQPATDADVISTFLLIGSVFGTLGYTAGVGGGTPAPVAPTAGTIAGTDVSSSGFTLTISGATGDLHAAPYAFSTDNGATWSAYQASPVLVVSGLAAATAYQCQGRVRGTTGLTATTAVQTVTTSASGVVPYKDAVLADSPTHLLMMDDDAGATVPARLGSGSGAVTAGSVAATFGQAALGTLTSSAQINGTNGGFFIADATFAGLTTWSAEAVVNYTGSAPALVSLVTSGNAATSNALSAGNAQSGGATVFGSAPGAGTTGHVALVYDGATLTFYKNGVASGTPATATAAIGAAARIYIGGLTPTAQAMTGRIGGVAIYKTALPAARVLAHAQAAGVA